MITDFTDNTGRVWSVEWRAGGQAMAVPLDLDVSKIPLPQGGLRFRTDGFGFWVEMPEADAGTMSDAQIQALIDEHAVG
jgi:hypothetical protein